MTNLASPFHVADFNTADAGALAGRLKALADPARLRILGLLRQHGPLTVTALVPMLGLSQGTVSHHLAVLRAAGMIEDRRVFRDSSRITLRVLCVDALVELAMLINPTVGPSGGGR